MELLKDIEVLGFSKPQTKTPSNKPSISGLNVTEEIWEGIQATKGRSFGGRFPSLPLMTRGFGWGTELKYFSKPT